MGPNIRRQNAAIDRMRCAVLIPNLPPNRSRFHWSTARPSYENIPIRGPVHVGGSACSIVCTKPKGNREIGVEPRERAVGAQGDAGRAIEGVGTSGGPQAVGG